MSSGIAAKSRRYGHRIEFPNGKKQTMHPPFDFPSFSRTKHCDSVWHIRRHFFSVLLGVMLLFTFSACTKQVRPTASPAPEAIKRDASLDELLRLYKQRQGGMENLKALMDAKTDLGEQGKFNFQSAWRSKGDLVKMKGFDLFGRTVFDLDLSGTHFSIFLPSQQKVFEGDLEFFDDMAGEKIPFGSLGLLEWVKRGGIPKVGPDRIPALEKREDVFILYIFSSELNRGFLKEKIWIERSDFRVKRVDFFDRSGLQKGIATLSDYQEVDGRFFPFSIIGDSRGQVLELKFKEVSFPTDPFSSRKK